MCVFLKAVQEDVGLRMTVSESMCLCRLRGSMAKSVVVVCQCGSSKIAAEGDLYVRVVVSVC